MFFDIYSCIILLIDILPRRVEGDSISCGVEEEFSWLVVSHLSLFGCVGENM